MGRFILILLLLIGMGAVAWFFTPARGYFEKSVELRAPNDFIAGTAENGDRLWSIHINASDITCKLTVKADPDMRGVIFLNAYERLQGFVVRSTNSMMQAYNPQVSETSGVQMLTARAGYVASGTPVINYLKAFGYGGIGYLYACSANPVDEAATQEALAKLTANIVFVRGFKGQ